ncbi:ATP-binding cassette domain-containing protein [Patescibacteria group bacterium]|nr:ATP-binding cassette domain-containing protein [Patescibacteria group bacterium]
MCALIQDSAKKGENIMLLEVKALTKIYSKNDTCKHDFEKGNVCVKCGSVAAVKDVSFRLDEGEVLSIVGESGSGKSTLLKILYFDIEPTRGETYLSSFEGGKRNLFSVDSKRKRELRNFNMGMVYQNPEDGIKPGISASGNVADKLLAANWRDFGRIKNRSLELLSKTEIPEQRFYDLTKNFSGGMKQRVQISKAMANNPELLLLDEPTTGLDVSVQARLLDMIRSIQQELGIATIMVTHDFGVAKTLADRIMVMCGGVVVESGLADQILEDPQHEYTQLLINSILG